MRKYADRVDGRSHKQTLAHTHTYPLPTQRHRRTFFRCASPPLISYLLLWILIDVNQPTCVTFTFRGRVFNNPNLFNAKAERAGALAYPLKHSWPTCEIVYPKTIKHHINKILWKSRILKYFDKNLSEYAMRVGRALHMIPPNLYFPWAAQQK